MIIKTASYNDGATSYNAAATESWWTSFTIQHRMNGPAECWITLADPTGAIMQKYDVTANDVYVGPGRVYIKNDAETVTYFDGRILTATHFRENGGSVVLYCQDWMSQLDEKHIIYDFREDLDGSDNRYDVVWPDENGIAGNTARPYYSGGGGITWLMCDKTGNQYHGADEWNDAAGEHYLVFLTSMGGRVVSKVGPYTETVTAVDIDTDTYDTDIGALWIDDSKAHLTADANEDWTVEYEFYSWINAAGTDYHTSTRDMHITGKLYFYSAGGDVALCNIKIYDNNAADYIVLEQLKGSDTYARRDIDLQVPLDRADHCVDANGIVKVLFDVKYNLQTDLNIYTLCVETECETTSEDTAYLIVDTAHAPDKIRIDTDLTLAGTGGWTGQEFAIIKKIYKHIDTAEGGTLISDNDPLVALTAAATVEHTTGLTVRRYEERTALEILDDARGADKAVFWMELGTTTFTWKSTFNAATTAINDSNVIEWSRGMYDYTPMRNEYHLYGQRANQSQLTLNTNDFAPDPGVDSQSTFGVRRSGVIKNTGTNTEYEMYQLGNALVERDEDVHLYISAKIHGLSTTYKLGAEVAVTSTPLNLAAVAYIITNWAYDYDADQTTISMLPRTASTKGLMDVGAQFTDNVRRTQKEQRRLISDIAMLEVIE